MMHDDNKTERILKMITLLKAHPQGLSRKDIARMLDIDLSTVTRYVRDVSLNLPITDGDDKRIYLEPGKFRIHMELSIYELVFVHLAARLFLRSLDHHNPYAGSCLSKLSALFSRFSPDISRFLLETAAALEQKKGKEDDAYVHVFRELTTAWVLQRKIRIIHFSHRRNEETEYLYHPYWIEPSSGKTSIYVFGYSEHDDQFRTFKIDRIRQADVLKQGFTIREDFRIEQYLGNAWGVWKSDESPVPVVLKFNPHARDRVLENSWHETEQTEVLPDGSLLWKAHVSQPLEMYPWIRGWGADVEVIEPEELRNAIYEEIKKMKKMYEK